MDDDREEKRGRQQRAERERERPDGEGSRCLSLHGGNRRESLFSHIQLLIWSVKNHMAILNMPVAFSAHFPQLYMLTVSTYTTIKRSWGKHLFHLQHGDTFSRSGEGAQLRECLSPMNKALDSIP